MHFNNGIENPIYYVAVHILICFKLRIMLHLFEQAGSLEHPSSLLRKKYELYKSGLLRDESKEIIKQIQRSEYFK